jgi:hypothetical protein
MAGNKVAPQPANRGGMGPEKFPVMIQYAPLLVLVQYIIKQGKNKGHMWG